MGWAGFSGSHLHVEFQGLIETKSCGRADGVAGAMVRTAEQIICSVATLCSNWLYQGQAVDRSWVRQ